MATNVSIRPLRRVEYDRLVDAGHFERERIELLDGRLIQMSPQKARHAVTVSRLVKILLLAIGDRADVRGQLPLAILDDSEPEPDVAVVPLGDYEDQHPTTALLVIEVADSSLAYDREEKARAYAKAGIAEYWVVNLVDSQIEVHLDPTPDRYSRITAHGRGDVVRLQGFPDLTIPANDVLPRSSTSRR